MKYKPYRLLEWRQRFTYLKNIVFDETDLRQAGAKFQIVRFAPGTSIAAHHHPSTVEIFYILRGTGQLHLTNRTFDIQADDIFLCQPNDSHSFHNTGQTELVVLIFKTNERSEDIVWETDVPYTG